MQIEKLYDKVAQTYNQNLSGEVLNKAKRIAVNSALNQRHALQSILALGMGDGTDLLPYVEHYPKADMHGLDISEKMLEKSKAILDCTTYYGDIGNASFIIPKKDFEFIIAHFVTAYVPLNVILRECKKLTAPSGLISIVTNTMDSFPVAQSLLAKLKNSSNPFYKLVAHHVHKTLQTVYVPKNLEDLKSVVTAQGLKLIELKEENISLQLNTHREAFDFFINGGWFVSGLIHPLLPHGLLSRICQQLINKNFTFPYVDTMKIAIAIAEV